jgi:hypothetical protein
VLPIRSERSSRPRSRRPRTPRRGVPRRRRSRDPTSRSTPRSHRVRAGKPDHVPPFGRLQLAGQVHQRSGQDDPMASAVTHVCPSRTHGVRATFGMDVCPTQDRSTGIDAARRVCAETTPPRLDLRTTDDPNFHTSRAKQPVLPVCRVVRGPWSEAHLRSSVGVTASERTHNVYITTGRLAEYSIV